MPPETALSVESSMPKTNNEPQQEKPPSKGPAKGLSRDLLSTFSLLLGAAFFFFVLMPAEAAFAQTCGGNNERYCCVWEGSACDSGHGGILATGPGTGQSCSNSGFPFFLNGSSAGTCYKTRTHPNFCGGTNQVPCALTVQATLGIASCRSNLIELVGPSGSRCRSIDGDGFPSHCGGLQEAPCILTEHIPSCKSDYFEYASVCNDPDPDGYPLFCGDELESPCNLSLQAQLGVTSCKGSLIESGGLCRDGDDLFPLLCGDRDERACTVIEHIPSCKSGLTELIGSEGAICREIGTDGFPNHCGASGQPACGLLENIPSCKAASYEVASGALPFPNNGWCVDEETFPAPRPQPASVQEPAPGPKTVFLIHGLGSAKSSFDKFTLDPGLEDLTVYTVDYNSIGNGVQDGLRVFVPNPGGDDTLVCTINSRLDGYTFSLPLVSRLLSEAIRDQTNCRTPGMASGPENIALVAHSMGGIVARDLVYRHFDSLLAEGIRITDVVTLGSPHRGGGGAIPEVADGSAAACLFTIADPRAHQICLMDKWQSTLQEARQDADAQGAPFIDNIDFPEIRWTTIAAADSTANTGLDFITFSDPVTRHDGLVAHVSAFSIASDLCFPAVDGAAPPLDITDRTAPNIDESAAWFDHYWPGVVEEFADFPLFDFDYNPWNGFNLGPMNLVTVLPTEDDPDTLTAKCHSPGPSKNFPYVSYLDPETDSTKVPDWAEGLMRYVGFPNAADFDAPHGDLVGAENVSEENENAASHVSIRNYVWTVLSDGMRTPDVNRDGYINQEDADLVSAAIDNTSRPSAYYESYELRYDLNGDGFTTQFDLDIVNIAVPEPGFGIGIALGALALLGTRRRNGEGEA